jgi:hypothetical protein
MDAKRRNFVALAVFGGLVCAPCAFADPPTLKSLIPFQRVEADRGKDYQLKEQHGPWLIMVHAFGGEHAKAEAHDLCLAMRKLNHKAYVHRQSMEFDEKPEGIGFEVKNQVLDRPLPKNSDPTKRLVKKQFEYHQKPEAIYHTVFVGDFSSVDDPALKKALEQIQTMKIDLEKPDPDSEDVVSRIDWFRDGVITGFGQNGGKAKKRGPLGRAFAAINPLGDAPYKEEGVVDNFVAQMNDTKYSLLNNPGKYTVKVGTFIGYDEWDAKKIEERERTGDMGDAAKRLMKAAEKADKLCAALRAKEYDAYVFHDRTESVVTIGAFDRVGDPRDDGKIEINPAVHRVMNEFKAKPVKNAGNSGAVSPRVFGGIACDANPMGDTRKKTASR